MYLIEKYFFMDLQERNNNRMALIRDFERIEPGICHEEVFEVIRTLKKRKATTIKAETPPRAVVLPTLGNVLGREVNRRLQSFLENAAQVDSKQYAYRQGTGIVDALKNYVQKLMETKGRKHWLTITLRSCERF